MKYKISIIIIVLTLCKCELLHSQVTIGSANPPHSDALLDLTQTKEGISNKGLLLPRVTLTSLNKSSPLSTHTIGMLVSSNSIKESSIYVNNGLKWLDLILPQNGKPGQILQIDSLNHTPGWNNINISKLESEKFYLLDTRSFKYNNIIALDNNNSDWVNLGHVLEIKPQYPRNRLVITVQAIISVTHKDESSTRTQEGWISFSCGIRSGAETRISRSDRLVKQKFNKNGAFQLMTFYFVLEDLPIAETNLFNIVFKRDASSDLKTVLHIGEAKHDGNSSAQTTETIISMQYFEDRFIK